MIWRHRKVLAYVALALATSYTFYVQHSDAARTTGALCTLRGDLETRVKTSQAFLVDHPNGIPGINAKVIRDGITNQQRTIHALRKLNC